MPSSVEATICASAPGMAMLRTASRSFGEKMQPDAEHQQDDADLRQLTSQILVSDEARRERTDGDTCQEVAGEGWPLTSSNYLKHYQ
jgi:hypothetical protein